MLLFLIFILFLPEFILLANSDVHSEAALELNDVVCPYEGHNLFQMFIMVEKRRVSMPKLKEACLYPILVPTYSYFEIFICRAKGDISTGCAMEIRNEENFRYAHVSTLEFTVVANELSKKENHLVNKGEFDICIIDATRTMRRFWRSKHEENFGEPPLPSTYERLQFPRKCWRVFLEMMEIDAETQQKMKEAKETQLANFRKTREREHGPPLRPHIIKLNELNNKMNDAQKEFNQASNKVRVLESQRRKLKQEENKRLEKMDSLRGRISGMKERDTLNNGIKALKEGEKESLENSQLLKMEQEESKRLVEMDTLRGQISILKEKDNTQTGTIDALEKKINALKEEGRLSKEIIALKEEENKSLVTIETITLEITKFSQESEKAKITLRVEGPKQEEKEKEVMAMQKEMNSKIDKEVEEQRIKLDEAVEEAELTSKAEFKDVPHFTLDAQLQDILNMGLKRRRKRDTIETLREKLKKEKPQKQHTILNLAANDILPMGSLNVDKLFEEIAKVELKPVAQLLKMNAENWKEVAQNSVKKQIYNNIVVKKIDEALKDSKAAKWVDTASQINLVEMVSQQKSALYNFIVGAAKEEKELNENGTTKYNDEYCVKILDETEHLEKEEAKMELSIPSKSNSRKKPKDYVPDRIRLGMEAARAGIQGIGEGLKTGKESLQKAGANTAEYLAEAPGNIRTALQKGGENTVGYVANTYHQHGPGSIGTTAGYLANTGTSMWNRGKELGGRWMQGKGESGTESEGTHHVLGESATIDDHGHQQKFFIDNISDSFNRNKDHLHERAKVIGNMSAEDLKTMGKLGVEAIQRQELGERAESVGRGLDKMGRSIGGNVMERSRGLLQRFGTSFYRQTAAVDSDSSDQDEFYDAAEQSEASGRPPLHHQPESTGASVDHAHHHHQRDGSPTKAGGSSTHHHTGSSGKSPASEDKKHERYDEWMKERNEYGKTG